MTKIVWYCALLLVAIAGSTNPVLAQTFTLITPVSAVAEVNSADAPNTIDDNPNEFTALVTYWQAAGDPEACITFDLGQVRQVGGIRETSGPFPGNPFTLFVSTDGVNFGQVTSGTLTQNAFGEHFFTLTSARFIKMCVQRTDATGFGELADFRALASEVLTVDIDIKPGSFPNSINLKSKIISVAILSSQIFDATTVDRSTVVFAGASPLSIGQTLEDVNGDGLLEMVLHFKTQDINLQLGDTEACLNGKTLGGQTFEGCDSIRIVK